MLITSARGIYVRARDKLGILGLDLCGQASRDSESQVWSHTVTHSRDIHVPDEADAKTSVGRV